MQEYAANCKCAGGLCSRLIKLVESQLVEISLQSGYYRMLLHLLVPTSYFRVLLGALESEFERRAAFMSQHGAPRRMLPSEAGLQSISTLWNAPAARGFEGSWSPAGASEASSVEHCTEARKHLRRPAPAAGLRE